MDFILLFLFFLLIILISIKINIIRSKNYCKIISGSKDIKYAGSGKPNDMRPLYNFIL